MTDQNKKKPLNGTPQKKKPDDKPLKTSIGELLKAKRP
jgi:hypothetical protein